MTRARAQRGLRSVGVLLALVTAASPLLDSLHEASVRHAACPEDGELIDVPIEAAHAHAKASGDGQSLFAESDPAAPRGAGADHGHCAIALRAHLRAREQSKPHAAVVSAELIGPAHVPPEPHELHGFTLYLLVPKASPPA